MPAKGSSTNPRYIGLDGRGFPTWMGSCGHPVYGRKTQFCQKCFGEGRRTRANNAGKINGRSVYTAGCGHLVKNWGTKRCAACRRAGRNKKYEGGWYKMLRPRGPNGERGELVSEHVVIAEAALGRKLGPNEVVHHIDMDKTNNRRGNLLICTKEYHSLIHYRMQLAWLVRAGLRQGV